MTKELIYHTTPYVQKVIDSEEFYRNILIAVGEDPTQRRVELFKARHKKRIVKLLNELTTYNNSQKTLSKQIAYHQKPIRTQYTEIYSKDLCKLFGDKYYSAILKCLKEQKIIEVMTSTTGAESYATDNTVSIIRKTENREINTYCKHYRLHSRAFDVKRNQMVSVSLEFNEREQKKTSVFDEFQEAKTELREFNALQSKFTFDNPKKIIAELLEDGEFSNLSTIQRIAGGTPRLIQKGIHRRLVSDFCNVPNKYMNNIKVVENGNSTRVFDLPTAQPLFAISVMKKENELRYASMDVMEKVQWNLKDDIYDKLYQVAEKGKFYEHFQFMVNQKFNTKYTRGDIKDGWMYLTSNAHLPNKLFDVSQQMYKVIKQQYPMLIEILIRLNSKQAIKDLLGNKEYNQKFNKDKQPFNYIYSNWESSLFKQITKELMNRFDCAIFMRYDAIGVDEEYADQVMEVVNEVASKFIGLNIKFKEEYYDEKVDSTTNINHPKLLSAFDLSQ